MGIPEDRSAGPKEIEKKKTDYGRILYMFEDCLKRKKPEAHPSLQYICYPT